MLNPPQRSAIKERRPPTRTLSVYLRHKLAKLYWSALKPRSLGARALVVDEIGRVLLVKHTYDSFWYLPGGGVKRGESLAAAVIRELEEEVALAGAAIDRILGIYHSNFEGKDDHIAVVIVRVPACEMDNLRASDEKEIAGVIAVPLSQIPGDTSPATRRRISEYVGGLQPLGQW